MWKSRRSVDRTLRRRSLLHPVSVVATVSIAFVFCSNGGKRARAASATPHVKPVITATLSHDTLAFTQGLAYEGGYLYESTGLYGHSRLRRLDPETGTVLQQTNLDERLFGEGLAVMGTRLVQLTWRAGRALVYSRSDFSVIDTYTYRGEGWGLTSTPNGYVMSNGTDTLYYRDQNFRPTHTVSVTLDGKPLTRLNELEFARGKMYANVWYSNYLFEINARSGVVERIVDCSELVTKAAIAGDENVLNGIAYNNETDRFFLTGKRWPSIFEVRIDALEQN